MAYTTDEKEQAALALGWVKVEGGWSHPINDEPEDPPFATADGVCSFERAYKGADGKWARGCKPWAHAKGCACEEANRVRVKG